MTDARSPAMALTLAIIFITAYPTMSTAAISNEPLIDPSMEIMEEDGVKYKAYKEEDLKTAGSIEDTVGGSAIKLEMGDIGMVTVKDVGTGDEIVKEINFWFSWYAFHPDTGLYDGS